MRTLTSYIRMSSIGNYILVISGAGVIECYSAYDICSPTMRLVMETICK